MALPPRVEVGSSIHCMAADCDRDVSISASLVPMDEPDGGQSGNLAAETLREFAMALGWSGVPFWRCPEHRLSADYPQGLVDRCIVELERHVGEVLSEVRLGIGRLESDAEALDSSTTARLEALERRPEVVSAEELEAITTNVRDRAIDALNVERQARADLEVLVSKLTNRVSGIEGPDLGGIIRRLERLERLTAGLGPIAAAPQVPE